MNRETEVAQPAEAGFKLHRRFDRMARLTSDAGMERLQGSLVVVMGLGGVGSFAAEALVRSGVGRLRLVDFDEVCVTNTNRQLHAMKGNIGKPKAQLLADRCALINPLAEVEPVYATLPGWRTELRGAKTFSDLHPNARALVELVEANTGVPVTLIGTGPERDDCVVR